MTQRLFSQQDLIDALQMLAERLGRAPKASETYGQPDVPSHLTYLKRFGSWREALEAAGIPPDPRSMGYDRETLLDHLRALAEQLGRTPTCGDVEAADGPCGRTYATHFGSWNAALAEAGLEIKRRNRRYDEGELLEILRDFAAELGQAPIMADLWERDDLPSPDAYRYRFGGWNAALRAAGLTPRHPMKRRDGGCDDDAGSDEHE